MLVLRFRDHTFVRLVSKRTGETLIKLKALGSGVIVGGSTTGPARPTCDWPTTARPSRYRGAVRDRCGVVATFGDVLEVGAAFTVEAGKLSADYEMASASLGSGPVCAMAAIVCV